jgi:hypothetical protein
MNSAEDLHKGGVSPFGHPRINDRSHLPAAFRSVPRPSSPLGAKASTERPSFTHLSPPPARRTNTQRAKAPSHQARMSNRTADTEYAFLSKTQHHQHQRQPKSQRASAAQGLLNTPFHLHLSKNTRNHPSQVSLARRPASQQGTGIAGTPVFWKHPTDARPGRASTELVSIMPASRHRPLAAPDPGSMSHREWRAEPDLWLVYIRIAHSQDVATLPHAHSLKGGDPAAGSPTATLLRLHPSR